MSLMLRHRDGAQLSTIDGISLKGMETLINTYPLSYQWYLNNKPLSLDDYKVYKLLQGVTSNEGTS